MPVPPEKRLLINLPSLSACVWTLLLGILGFALAGLGPGPTYAQASDSTPAPNGGLAVWVDPAKPAAPVEMARRGQRLVHVLVRSEEDAAAVASLARESGLGGVVTAQAMSDLSSLPFADRSVNLVVATTGATPEGELRRILAPRGMLRVREGDREQTWSAPSDPGDDVWTHKWKDATGNAVSRDRRVVAPTSLRWIAGPQSDVGSMPQQGFRVNDGLAVVEWELGADGPQTSRQFMIARDAFNGTVRWIRDSGPLTARQMLPTDPYKLIVLEQGSVFTVLEQGGRVVALDDQTGTIRRTYDHSLPVSNKDRWYLVVSGGHLVHTVDSEVRVLDVDSGELQWSWQHPDGEGEPTKPPAPWYDVRWQPGALGRPVIAPDHGLVILVAQTQRVEPFRLAIPARHPPFWTGEILALDLETGAIRWRRAMDGEPINQLAVQGKHLGYLEVGMLSGPTSRKNVSFGVLDAATGDLRWRKVLPPGTKHPSLGAGMTMGLFNDRYWLATRSLTSYDIETGEELSSLDIQGNPTCAAPRLTDRTLIHAQDAYIDIEAQVARHVRISRSTCGTEPTPAYGLQYFMPNRCTCSSFLRGHLALSSDPVPPPADNAVRLHRVSDSAGWIPPVGAWPEAGTWPTFLGDSRRFALATVPLPRQLSPAWTVRPALPPAGDSPIRRDWTLNNLYNGPVSGAVGDGRTVVVALPLEHAVQARSAETGEILWTFPVGTRVDTPPTIYGNRVFFGSRGGYVYALDAATGRLVWRFLAARSAHRMVAYGQVESRWPVHGSVLVHGGLVVAAAGYHPETDGGILVWALDPASGTPRWRRDVARVPRPVSPDIKRGRWAWGYPEPTDTTSINNYHVHNMVRNGILQSSGNLVLLPGYALEGASGTFAGKYMALEVASGHGLPPERITSYIWGNTTPLYMNHRLSDYGGPGEAEKIPLALRTPETAPHQVLGSHLAVDGAAVFSARPMPRRGLLICRHDGRSRSGGGEPEQRWSHRLTGWRPAGLVAAADGILVALESLDTPWAERTGLLQVRDRDTGDVVQEMPLSAPPAENAVAVVQGSVYVSLLNGDLVCFRGGSEP